MLDVSMRRGSGHLLHRSHNLLASPHSRHSSLFTFLRRQGCPGASYKLTQYCGQICFLGIRKSRHLQTRPTSYRRGAGSRRLLCYSLCGCLREDWYAEPNFWNSASRGKFSWNLRCCMKSKVLLQILTKDSVTVFVNAIMYYKVANAIHAVANVDDYGGSARLLAATTLRNVLGTMTLGDILCNREAIAKEMKAGCGNER